MIMSITSTTARTLLRNSTVIGRRSLSVQGQQAVGRLKDALEQYRVENYQQEIPTRFKKDMVTQCNASSFVGREKAVEGIEGLLQNIGVFGVQVTHDDVECIVTELGETDETIRADTILSKIL